MNMAQFRSKCCNARIIQDYTEVNNDNESYTPARWKCVRCGKIVDEITISRRTKRLK